MMKASTTTENTEVTPSKKKLKQATLPFKLISEASTSPKVPLARKRKLSTPEAETPPKIGKFINPDSNTIKEFVVIEDESGDEKTPQTEEKPKLLNPYVKIVDNIMKKKLSKGPKKKRSKENAKEKCITKTTERCIVSNDKEIVSMEVDEPSTEQNEFPSNPKISEGDNENNSRNLLENTSTKKIMEEIIVLEDSKSSSDIIPNNTILEPEVIVDEVATPDVNEIDKENMKESPGKVFDKIITTPKRSVRIKASVDEQNSSIKSMNKSDENTTTPNQNTLNSSVTNSADKSLNESVNSINLTPKQLQKKLEFSKKKEEKEKEKLEREKKRLQEKEERAKEKQEKEELKKKEREEKSEARKKEKEEKEEQKKKEKEEKERQKELERKEKEELRRKEKEEKEEQKRKEKEAKEEERRKKQEALELEKQEQEMKKKKAAEAFVNFFVPKQKCDIDKATSGPISKNSMLSSFTIKADMRLAPTVRTELDESKRKELDNLIENQIEDVEQLYIKSLKKGAVRPMCTGKTWPLSDKDDDCVIIEDELSPMDSIGEIITCQPAVGEKMRPKLLGFHENRRPPYWGTWRKKSAFIKPRRPFGQDQKQLDYEVDSDEEWEEEQEGESIDGSAAGSDDEQDADEYEVDNEVFVPHGYLSDEEATVDEDDVFTLSPETQKARLKHLEDEFESELKKPTEKLKPRLYGLLWANEEGGKPENCVDALWNYFGKLSMIMNDPAPLLQQPIEPEESEKKKSSKKKKGTTEDMPSPQSEKKKKVKLESKENKKFKVETNKVSADGIKKQPAINSFLTKLSSQ